ncbi:leucine-rich repeat-containing protein egg-6-like [Chironomus tepperi]|uniref:leucine-rich repeat-containing protein egg-6-like n=1 Tax=Chironomus tepperi TaxID=113505 RepID=UPI00391FBA11
MAKIVMFLICIVGLTVRFSTSTAIDCDYLTRDHTTLRNSYDCIVSKDPIIATQESAAVTSVTGSHQIGKSNSDVGGFTVDSKTINYFPRGLEFTFNNLKLIFIKNCNLKEVHQEDLKPFPKLVELHLHVNALEVLEEGLLDFNPQLEYISFFNNKLVHIESNIFNHLCKLKFLYLQSNTCIDKKAENSISGVKNVIKSAQSQCTKVTSMTDLMRKIDQQFTDLKMEMRKEITTTLESWMEQKLEKIFDDKLSKIFEEKCSNVIGFN